MKAKDVNYMIVPEDSLYAAYRLGFKEARRKALLWGTAIVVTTAIVIKNLDEK